MLALELFILIVAANGAPVILRMIIGRRGAAPIDGERVLSDGSRVLGASKTWRGLIAGGLSAAVISAFLGLGVWFGAAIGLAALVGDCLSSFIKRRLHFDHSARATGLDQIPESLLPMLLAWLWLDLSFWWVVIVTLLFMLADMTLSPLLYRLGIRRHPH